MTQELYVGTRKGLFRVSKSQGSWKVTGSHFLGERVSAVEGSHDDSVLHAALDLGHFGVKMRRSTDRGEQWSEASVPTYPPKPEGLEDLEPNSRKPIPWNTELIWTLEAGSASKPERLWCGTIPGGLFRSDDAGESWELVRSLWDEPKRRKWFGGGYDMPGIHSICVHPQNDARVSIGISCGGVWHSIDEGETWTVESKGMFAAFMPPARREEPEIQDPHRIVLCPSRPERMWCQHHNGIFVSDDTGRSWRSLEAKPSTFGFAVAVHPRDPDTAWFVPAQKDEQRIPVDGELVVLRTRNGGQSFEKLRGGLPTDLAYDLVFRHALAVDQDGGCLAFGSTTGGLWISEDQGESWTLLSARLPPVHCLRWI